MSETTKSANITALEQIEAETVQVLADLNKTLAEIEAAKKLELRGAKHVGNFPIIKQVSDTKTTSSV